MAGKRDLKSFRFGEFSLESRLQRLVCRGRIIPLKPKAFDLLCVLLTNRERVLGKDELLEWLWPNQEVSEANLSQTVYELRRALGDNARNERWIETIPRRGYRFAGSVLENDGGNASDLPRSIAVLPFRVLTPDLAVRELGLGVADSIIQSLSSSGGIVVRPLSSVLQHGASDQDALVIGKVLEVDSVLEGTLQVYDGRVRINARLLQLPGGKSTWAGSHELDFDNPFAVQDGLAVKVAEAIAKHLGDDGRNRFIGRPPAHPDVQALYLKARYCWQSWAPGSLRQALDYLDRAIALDPAHAPSHAWRAAAFATLGIVGALSPTEAAKQARLAATRAVELDAGIPDGHEMLGAVRLFFDWDFEAAARSLDRAIELSPDSSNARHLRALVLALSGFNDAALAEMLRAVRADPSSLIAKTDVGLIHYWGRRYPEARAWLERTLEQEAGFSHARSALAYVLLESGEHEEAVKQITRSVDESGRGAHGEIAYILGRSGRREEATAIITGLLDERDRLAADPFQLMIGYMGLSDYPNAFEWLDRALEHCSRDLLLLGVSPVMDPVRADPRFKAFLREAGLARST